MDSLRDWVGDIADVWLESERIQTDARIGRAAREQSEQIGPGQLTTQYRVPRPAGGGAVNSDLLWLAAFAVAGLVIFQVSK